MLVPRLLDAGYSVELFASSRVADLCSSRFSGCCVHRIPGLRLRYRANRLDVPRTVLSCIDMALRGARASLYVREQARLRLPIAAISDYDPVVAWAAAAIRLPLIALDHQQIATECPVDLGSSARLALSLLRLSNRMTYRQPNLRIITSFFQAPLRERRGPTTRTLIAPVLRPEVVQRHSAWGKHLVVYQTSRTLEWLDRILNAIPGEKRVYGAGEKQSGQTEHAFDENCFLEDLASCRFALVNGGHTTISEALYFGKPILCFPIRGQAEQEMNAHYVAKLGFGKDYRPASGEVPDFGEFLSQEESIRERIARRSDRCGNDELLRTVLGRLAEWSGKV